MTAFSPCSGSSRPAVNPHRVNTAGLGSKFSHMRGKTYGACSECGRTGLVVRADGNIPNHKRPLPVWVDTLQH